MPTHGEKRISHGKDQIFHHYYGWISVREFYDLLPDYSDSDNEISIEPSQFSRQPHESFSDYRSRIREIEDNPRDD